MTSDRIFAALLRLYPKSFRHEYGDEMIAAFRQLRRGAGRSRLGFWSFVLADVAGSVPAAWFDEWRHGPQRIALRFIASGALGFGATVLVAHVATWTFRYFYHPYFEGFEIPVLPYGIALGLVLGATVGIAQWMLLPARVRRASGWALASAVALPIAVLFCSTAINRAIEGLNPVAAQQHPLAFDLLVVGLGRTTTWADITLQFAAMATTALTVRALMRLPLMERHAH